MERFLEQFHLSGISAPELSDSSISRDGQMSYSERDDNCTADCGEPADGCEW